MAELPNTYARRPTARFGGVRQANPVVAPADIAEGQGLQRLGAEVAEMFVGIQLQADRTELQSRTTKYKAEVLDLQREWEQQKSADVAENPQFYPEYIAKHDEIKARILGDASNHRVSGALTQQLELGDINVKEGLISHINKERDNYNLQTYQTATAVSVDMIAANPYNDSVIAQQRKAIIAATEQFAAQNDLPVKTRDFMIKENLSKAHIEVIEARINDDQHESAETYFWKNDEEIMGDAHTKILKTLDASGTAYRTQELSDTAYARFSDDRKSGMAYIRENADPKDREEALRQLTNRYNEDDKQESDGFHVAGVGVRGQYSAMIEAGISPSDAWKSIPLTKKLEMKPSELMAMQSRVDNDITGKTVKTDIQTYFQVEQFIRENPEQAKNMDLSMWDSVISPTDLKTLNTLRHKDINLLGTETSLLKEGLLMINIDPKELNNDSNAGRKARAFQKWVRDNLPVDYDETDLEKTILKGATKIVTDDGWIWDTEEFAYTLEVEGVKPTEIGQFALMVKALGMAQTPSNIKAAAALSEAGEEVTVENMNALTGADIAATPAAIDTTPVRDLMANDSFEQAGRNRGP